MDEGLIIPAGKAEFDSVALDMFRLQAVDNPVYSEFVGLLGIDPRKVKSVTDIPFMPVSLFKSHRVLTGGDHYEALFTSSGTTGSTPSKHYVRSLALYEHSFTAAFRHFYGDIPGYTIAALLPSYVERGGSSLVYMAEHLVAATGSPLSGFYDGSRSAMAELVARHAGNGHEQGRQLLIIGVTWALLKMAREWGPDLKGAIVMETGGMKGMGHEMVREELHAELCGRLNIEVVHSEYGMCELLSQAYSKGGGRFYTPPWMKALVADTTNPLSLSCRPGVRGSINVIDLANRHSCAFVATADLGVLCDDGGFEITGRIDNSEVRGCNLL